MKLQDANLADPDSGFYDRARRFVRLWRKLGWSIFDLDKVLIALRATEIDNAVLESISHIRRIRDAVRIDLVSLLSLWSDLDMKLDRPARDVAIVPLYDRVFLDHAVITDEDELAVPARRAPKPAPRRRGTVGLDRRAASCARGDSGGARRGPRAGHDPHDPHAVPALPHGGARPGAEPLGGRPAGVPRPCRPARRTGRSVRRGGRHLRHAGNPAFRRGGPGHRACGLHRRRPALSARASTRTRRWRSVPTRRRRLRS